ncbi:MAG: MFS transporter [Dehalococcoidales bacterium]|nr:MFS transporter [Dehalococcoidales bacterium]
MSELQKSDCYKWLMLGLSAITATLVIAIPYSCMPSLFKEISDDLGLSLVQIGSIWGISNLAAIFVSLPGGLIGDRFRLRLVLFASCILVGVTGALRGLSTNFFTLAATVFLNGLVRAIVPIITTRTILIWFKGKNLAMANGVGAMGMGLGLMLGPMISATYLSPLLGGWRIVLILYGIIAAGIGVLWLLAGKEPPDAGDVSIKTVRIPVRQAITGLINNKAVRLIGLTLMFRSACITGMMGYLPMYLRDKGFSAAVSDNALAIFFAASTICVVPFSILSDRIGSRRTIILPALVVTTLCVGMIPLADSHTIWTVMILSGIFFDGFMSVISATLFESKGVGPLYSGTALGMVFTFGQIGSAISPPLGNSLAVINTGSPFIFWSIISVAAIFTAVFIKETGWRKKQIDGSMV